MVDVQARTTEETWKEHGLAPGDVVGDRYVLREIVGEGGMGRVFRADDLSSARQVAIKLVRPAMAGDPRVLRSFAEEAHLAGLVRHAGSAAILDQGLSRTGGPYLVMELVRGSTLGALLAAEGSLSLRRIADLLGQVLAALEVAHAAGVVHGDLKCENVLVTRTEDGTEVAKIIDYGLARRSRALREAALSGEETVCGTPDYIAPEVILGRGGSPSADLYAVGVMLDELLTGRPPFAGGTPEQILARHLHDAVVPPSLRRPDRSIPSALDAVVLRALAKVPEHRFPDAAALRAALEEAIATAPIEGLAPCPTCGEARPREAAFCPMCGMSAALGDDLDTLDLMPPAPPPRPRLARGSRPPRDPDRGDTAQLRALRHAIAGAMRRGVVDEIAGAYLELARELAAADRLPAAIGELEEGIDVVTAGRRQPPHAAPAALPRLLGGLAGLYALAGNRKAARRAIIQAHWLRMRSARAR